MGDMPLQKSLTDAIFDAISTIADSKIKSVSFDNTIICTILNIDTKASNELYTAYNARRPELGTSTIVIYGPKAERYGPGDRVYVTIPQNDYSQQKIITGRVIDNTNISNSIISPMDRIIKVWPRQRRLNASSESVENVFSPEPQKSISIFGTDLNDDENGQICLNYSENIEDSAKSYIYYFDKFLNLNNDIDRLAVAANVTIDLDELKVESGKYGLKFTLLGIDPQKAPFAQSTKPSEHLTAEGNTDLVITTDYIFSSDNMTGFIYTQDGNPQSYEFDISAFRFPIGGIKISLILLEEFNIYDEENQEYIRITSDENLYNITIEDIHFAIGQSIKPDMSEGIYIYSPNLKSYGDYWKPENKYIELDIHYLIRRSDGILVSIDSPDELITKLNYTNEEKENWLHNRYIYLYEYKPTDQNTNIFISEVLPPEHYSEEAVYQVEEDFQLVKVNTSENNEENNYYKLSVDKNFQYKKESFNNLESILFNQPVQLEDNISEETGEVVDNIFTLIQVPSVGLSESKFLVKDIVFNEGLLNIYNQFQESFESLGLSALSGQNYYIDGETANNILALGNIRAFIKQIFIYLIEKYQEDSSGFEIEENFVDKYFDQIKEYEDFWTDIFKNDAELINHFQATVESILFITSSYDRRELISSYELNNYDMQYLETDYSDYKKYLMKICLSFSEKVTLFNDIEPNSFRNLIYNYFLIILNQFNIVLSENDLDKLIIYLDYLNFENYILNIIKSMSEENYFEVSNSEISLANIEEIGLLNNVGVKKDDETKENIIYVKDNTKDFSFLVPQGLSIKYESNEEQNNLIYSNVYKNITIKEPLVLTSRGKISILDLGPYESIFGFYYILDGETVFKIEDEEDNDWYSYFKQEEDNSNSIRQILTNNIINKMETEKTEQEFQDLLNDSISSCEVLIIPNEFFIKLFKKDNYNIILKIPIQLIKLNDEQIFYEQEIIIDINIENQNNWDYNWDNFPNEYFKKQIASGDKKYFYKLEKVKDPKFIFGINDCFSITSNGRVYTNNLNLKYNLTPKIKQETMSNVQPGSNIPDINKIIEKFFKTITGTIQGTYITIQEQIQRNLGLIVESEGQKTISGITALGLWSYNKAESPQKNSVDIIDYKTTFIQGLENNNSNFNPSVYGYSCQIMGNLNVEGTIYGIIGQSSSSDQRLKINIDSLNNNYLNLYDNLNPVSYELLNKQGFTRLGFLAQEVEQTLKDNNIMNSALINIKEVDANENIKDGKQYFIELDNLHALHVAKNHQQDERIKILEQEVKELKEQLKALREKGVK